MERRPPGAGSWWSVEISRQNGLPLSPAQEPRLGDDEVLIDLEPVGVAIGAGGDIGGHDRFTAQADFVLPGFADDALGALDPLLQRMIITDHNKRNKLAVVKIFATCNN